MNHIAPNADTSFSPEDVFVLSRAGLDIPRLLKLLR